MFKSTHGIVGTSFQICTLAIASEALVGCGPNWCWGYDCGSTTTGDTDDPNDEPNQEVPTDPCVFEKWDENEYQFDCVNDTSNYAFNGVEYATIDLMTVCIPLNPQDDYEDDVKEACSARCKEIAQPFMTLYDHNCEDEHWSDLLIGWKKEAPGECLPKTCSPDQYSLDIDQIENVLGLSAAEAAQDLPCDLGFDCQDYLDSDEILGLWTEHWGAGVASSADEHVSTANSTGASAVYFLGEGQSIWSLQTLSGDAAYTATACGYDACPFYLAQFNLSTTSSFDATFDYAMTTTTKTVDDFTVSLKRPALGIWLPSTGDIIFPNNSLTLELSLTLTGVTNVAGENGSYDEVFWNDPYIFGESAYVFGTLSSSGDLFIGKNGVTPVGLWGVVGNFSP